MCPKNMKQLLCTVSEQSTRQDFQGDHNFKVKSQWSQMMPQCRGPMLG